MKTRPSPPGAYTEEFKNRVVRGWNQMARATSTLFEPVQNRFIIYFEFPNRAKAHCPCCVQSLTAVTPKSGKA